MTHHPVSSRPKNGPGLRYKRTSIIQGGKAKRGYRGSEQLQWATPEDQKEIEGKKKKSESESVIPSFGFKFFPKSERARKVVYRPQPR